MKGSHRIIEESRKVKYDFESEEYHILLVTVVM